MPCTMVTASESHQCEASIGEGELSRPVAPARPDRPASPDPSLSIRSRLLALKTLQISDYSHPHQSSFTPSTDELPFVHMTMPSSLQVHISMPESTPGDTSSITNDSRFVMPPSSGNVPE